MKTISENNNHPRCCADHECDNCAKCRSGRCCRTDNPNYKLPEFGSWTEAVHGEYGKMFHAEGKVECHVCGEFFGHLGAHVSRAHDLTPDEYKVLFGLKFTTALIGSDLADKRRENVAHLEQFKGVSSEFLKSATPEQRKYWHKNRSNRGASLEERSDPNFKTRRQKALEKGKETQHKKFLERHPLIICPVCKKEFRERKGQLRNNPERKYCSQECYIKCPVRIKRGAKMCRAQVAKTKGKPPKYVHRCPVCQKLFRSRSETTVYCGQECFSVGMKSNYQKRNVDSSGRLLRK